MADAVDKLQKLTECSICHKEFTDPRLLPCIHTFCLPCLKQIEAEEAYHWSEMTPHLYCPVCYRECEIPAEGLHGLKKNFFIQNLIEVTRKFQLSDVSAIACEICKNLHESPANAEPAKMRCLECSDCFCNTCAKSHTLHKLNKNHHIVKIGSETLKDMRKMFPPPDCDLHKLKPLEYYCPSCKKIVCVSCVIETHASHGCRDMSTVEDNFRQTIGQHATKISAYADETVSMKMSMVERKASMLLKLKGVEAEILERDRQLRKLIDNHTKFLIDDLNLSGYMYELITNFESDIEDIDLKYSILKQFETYCSELSSTGSKSEICSCADELITRANELEEVHEKFIRRPYLSNEVSFTMTYPDETWNARNNNIVGNINVNCVQTVSRVLIAGLHDGQNLTTEVFNIDLHSPLECFDVEEVPTKMQNQASAATYRNSIYITGIGDKCDEIWKYNNADYFWQKCASFVQGRRGHCSAFVNGVLYICGGSLVSVGTVLDSVEAYDASTHICRYVGKLVNPVQHSGNCVPFKSSVYIFGGSDKGKNVLNQVQVYDCKHNTCTVLFKPMPRGYNFMAATVWDTSVILLGWDTCFMFNFETGIWQERNQFKTGVIHFGLAFENGRIFVIGGGMSATDATGKARWTCRDDVRYVPLNCIIDDKPAEWKTYSKLQKPVLVQTYGTFIALSLEGDYT